MALTQFHAKKITGGGSLMAIWVPVKFEQSFSSSKSLSEVRAYLSNVSESIGNQFPGLKEFVCLKDNLYRWVFQEVSYSSYRISITAITQIDWKDENQLSILSDDKSSHATGKESQINGMWEVSEKTFGTKQIKLLLDTRVRLDLPVLIKPLASSVTEKELKKIYQQYFSHVESALSS